MTLPQAVSNITSKIDPFWADRVHSMLVSSCICKRGSFPAEISNLRVNPDWPRKGSITLTRGDKNRVRLYMTKRDGFKISIKNNS
mgnify:CR=1